MNSRLHKILRTILFITAFTVITVGIVISIEETDHESIVMEQLRFVDEYEGKELEFALWKAKREDTYYMILPSGYTTQELEAKISYHDTFYDLYIDDVKYESGSWFRESLQEQIHQIKLVDFLGRIHMEKPFLILVSEGQLPAMMVTVESREGIEHLAEFSNQEYMETGQMVFMDEQGELVLETTLERFKVRGNLTSTLDKKPYTITLKEAFSFCQMPKARNWHLLADATDGSHIRNKLMMDWAGEMCSGYQPQGEFVELFINGEYQGLYLLTETIEIGENRLQLDVSNSVLAEMELSYRAKEEENCIVTKEEHYWVAHSQMPLPQSDLEEIKEYLNEIESALYSSDGYSKNSGKALEELLDFDSWTDTWLLKEISSDHDLGTTSQFGIVENWKERSIFLAGPEWDFDGTLGNGMVPWARNPRNLVTAIYNTKGIESVSQNKWLAQMYQQEGFRKLLTEKFRDEVQPKIERLLEYEIEDYVNFIRRSALLDSLRWNGNDIHPYFAFPQGYSIPTEGDYHKYDVIDSHVQVIRDFLMEKSKFLQELWLEGVEFEVVIEEHNEEGMSKELNNDVYTWIRK